MLSSAASFTGSQMFENWRDLWRPSGPIPLFRQGHLESSGQVYVWMSSEYLQESGIHNLPGLFVPVLGHSLTEKMGFLVVRGKLLYFSLHSDPVTAYHWAKHGSIFFTPSLQIFFHFWLVHVANTRYLLNAEYLNSNFVTIEIKLPSVMTDELVVNTVS